MLLNLIRNILAFKQNSNYREENPYFVVQYGNNKTATIEFELFWDVVPKTCQNFANYILNKGKTLSYLNTQFHRIIKDFMIQGGIVKGHAKSFKDENFKIRHGFGVLSMANAGRDTNSSQFFITVNETSHLDGRHVVFGRVISNMNAVVEISKVETDSQDRPLKPVTIVECGFKPKSYRKKDI